VLSNLNNVFAIADYILVTGNGKTIAEAEAGNYRTLKQL